MLCRIEYNRIEEKDEANFRDYSVLIRVVGKIMFKSIVR